MIEDILFEWNVLTVTIAAWFGCVALVAAGEAAPGMYRDWETHRRQKKNAEILEWAVLMRSQKQHFHINQARELDEVYKIQPTPVRRRHAKI